MESLEVPVHQFLALFHLIYNCQLLCLFKPHNFSWAYPQQYQAHFSVEHDPPHFSSATIFLSTIRLSLSITHIEVTLSCY